MYHTTEMFSQHIKMPDYFSNACQIFRYSISAIGCLLACAFLFFGIALASDGEKSVQNDLTIAFGAFMATMSATILCVTRTSDRQAKRLMAAMNTQLNQLQQTNDSLHNRVDQLDDLQARLQTSIDAQQARNKRLADERKKLSAENQQLANTTRELDDIKEAYQQQLTKARTTTETLHEELKSLREIAGDESLKVERLSKLNDEQRQRIHDLSEQLENLNELQRRSTKMIQLLALYGDECKTLGLSLKDTSKELRETDTSLGLTAAEMAQQLHALRTVTEQLTHVSLTRVLDSTPQDESDEVGFVTADFV